MSKPLPVSKIIDRAGGNTALARQLGIKSQSICKWRRLGSIPIERVPMVSDVTGIPRHIIRPDRPDLFPPPNEERAA